MSAVLEYVFPEYYHFPPFFTLQVVEETQQKQLQLWTSFVCSYLKYHNKSRINVNVDRDTPLFHNKELNRQMSVAGVTAVLDYMVTQGYGVWQDGDAKTVCVCSHTPLSVIADQLFKYADDTGQLSSMFTVFELVAGADTKKQPFYGLDAGVVAAACSTVLVPASKATVMPGDDPSETGVKFHYP